MSELSAFLAGLILGDTGSVNQCRNFYPNKHTNIALQDTIFCQCLANIIAELEQFVKTKNPSPEEFIRHLLPEVNFESPYSDDESEILKCNEENVCEYIEWINDLSSKNQLLDDNGNHFSRYEDLSAIRRIWQDPSHTPDVDNLDLIFGIGLAPWNNPTIKKNGVIYEYKAGENPIGIAKGFFLTVPAKLIFSTCVKCTIDLLKEFGYQYDNNRFEYNKKADKNNSLHEWMQKQRERFYRVLMNSHPSFCKIPWSELTRCIHTVKDYSIVCTDDRRLTRKDKRLRRKEILDIKTHLSKEEKKKYSLIDVEALLVSRNKLLIKSMFYVLSLPIFIVLFFIGIILNNKNPDSLLCIVPLTLSMAIFFTFLVTAIIDSDKVEKYLRFMQKEYYFGNNNEAANEYKKLLSRISQK